jgi:hypothetical protein
LTITIIIMIIWTIANPNTRNIYGLKVRLLLKLFKYIAVLLPDTGLITCVWDSPYS